MGQLAHSWSAKGEKQELKMEIKTPWEKWEQKYNVSKLKGCGKINFDRAVHSNQCFKKKMKRSQIINQPSHLKEL